MEEDSTIKIKRKLTEKEEELQVTQTKGFSCVQNWRDIR
jgi:hypothetical protein